MTIDRDILLRRTAKIRHQLAHLEHVANEAHNAANALRHEETSILQQLRTQERDEIARHQASITPTAWTKDFWYENK